MRFSLTPIVILGFLLLSLVLTGCSKTGSDESSSISLPPPNGSGGTGGGGGGPVEEGVFELVMIDTPSYYSHTLHKDGAVFTEPCRVSDSDTGSDRDITCLLDANELDLYTFGMKLQIRASQTVCEHVGFTGYFYYVDDIDPSKIPTDVVVIETVTGDIDFDPVTGSSFTDSITTYTGSAALSDFIKAGPKVFCPYDYTPYDGPNCCEGSYNYSYTDKLGTNTKSVEEWGGKLSDCISGAGTELPLTKDGWPMEVITSPTTPVPQDITAEFEPSTPISLSERIIYLANYFSGARPAGFDLNFDGIQQVFEDNDYYTWYCYDASKEVNARIRLRVREWNTGSTVDPANDPDLPAGNEDPPFDDYLLNDFSDWDDYGLGFPDYYLPGAHW